MSSRNLENSLNVTQSITSLCSYCRCSAQMFQGALGELPANWNSGSFSREGFSFGKKLFLPSMRKSRVEFGDLEMTRAVKDKAINCPWVTALLQRHSAVSLLPGQGMLVELLHVSINPGSSSHGHSPLAWACRSGKSQLLSVCCIFSPHSRGSGSTNHLEGSSFQLSSFPHHLSQRTLFLSHLFFKEKPR